MQKTLLTATVVVAMITPAALAVAGDRTVTVPTPRSITIVCSDSVKPGMVVLTNPPKFSCKDYEMAKSFIGSGVTIGPDDRARKIAAALLRAQKRQVIVDRVNARQPGGVWKTENQLSKNTVVKPVPNQGGDPLVNPSNPPNYKRLTPPVVNNSMSVVQRLEMMRREEAANREAYWRAWDQANGTYSGKFEGIRRNRSFFNTSELDDSHTWGPPRRGAWQSMD